MQVSKEKFHDGGRESIHRKVELVFEPQFPQQRETFWRERQLCVLVHLGWEVIDDGLRGVYTGNVKRGQVECHGIQQGPDFRKREERLAHAEHVDQGVQRYPFAFKHFNEQMPALHDRKRGRRRKRRVNPLLLS